MSVVLYRIDDRLIHGQVMTAWTKVYNSTNILCADDETAKNEMICSIMKLAVPSDFQLEILTVNQAIDAIKALPENKRTIVLAKSPATMLALAEAEISMKELNVGNMGQGPGRKAVVRSTQVSPEELKQLQKIETLGIKVYFQSYPDGKSVNLNEIKL